MVSSVPRLFIGRPRLRPCRAAQDRSAIHVPARVRPEASARGSALQAGVERVQGGAANPDRSRQGEEPVAECGRSLRRAAAVLRPVRDELLHGDVRRVASIGRVGFADLGPCPGLAAGAAQVLLDARSEEASQQISGACSSFGPAHYLQIYHPKSPHTQPYIRKKRDTETNTSAQTRTCAMFTQNQCDPHRSTKPNQNPSKIYVDKFDRFAT